MEEWRAGTGDSGGGPLPRGTQCPPQVASQAELACGSHTDIPVTHNSRKGHMFESWTRPHCVGSGGCTVHDSLQMLQGVATTRKLTWSPPLHLLTLPSFPVLEHSRPFLSDRLNVFYPFCLQRFPLGCPHGEDLVIPGFLSSERASLSAPVSQPCSPMYQRALCQVFTQWCFTSS